MPSIDEDLLVAGRHRSHPGLTEPRARSQSRSVPPPGACVEDRGYAWWNLSTISLDFPLRTLSRFLVGILVDAVEGDDLLFSVSTARQHRCDPGHVRLPTPEASSDREAVWIAPRRPRVQSRRRTRNGTLVLQEAYCNACCLVLKSQAQTLAWRSSCPDRHARASAVSLYARNVGNPDLAQSGSRCPIQRSRLASAWNSIIAPAREAGGLNRCPAEQRRLSAAGGPHG